MSDVVVSFSGENGLRVIPASIPLGETGVLMSGDQTLAKVGVGRFDNKNRPVMISFKRVSDQDPNTLSGHADSATIGMDDETTIGFPGWFEGLVAIASNVETV